jgi:hypothetical protein
MLPMLLRVSSNSEAEYNCCFKGDFELGFLN